MSLWDDIIKGGIEIGANLLMQDRADDAAMDRLKASQSGAGAQVGVNAGKSSATTTGQSDRTSTIDTTEQQDTTSRLDTTEASQQTSQQATKQEQVNETIQNILNNSQLDSSSRQQLESMLTGSTVAGTAESREALAGIFEQIDPNLFSRGAAERAGADASALAIQQALQSSFGEIAGMGAGTGTFGSTAQAQLAQLAQESAARTGTEANLATQNLFAQNRQSELDLLLNAISAGQAGQQQTSQQQQQQQTGSTTQTGQETTAQTGRETGSTTGTTTGTVSGTTTGSTAGTTSTTGTSATQQDVSETTKTAQEQEQATVDKILSSQTDKTNADWLANQFYGGDTGTTDAGKEEKPEVGRENEGEHLNKPKLPGTSPVKGAGGVGR